MTADITKTFWGKEPSSKDDANANALCGCKPEREVSTAMRMIIKICGANITAREVMQSLLHDEGQHDLPLPEWVANKTPPENPNVYGDGSLKNPGVGSHWMVGGFGVWWPGRKPGDIEESTTEEWYTKNEYEEAGYRIWGVFNNLRNDSTRCEIGAGLVSMSPAVETNIGIDNKACVDISNDIIDHARRKAKTVLRTKGGAPIL